MSRVFSTAGRAPTVVCVRGSRSPARRQRTSGAASLRPSGAIHGATAGGHGGLKGPARGLPPGDRGMLKWLAGGARPRSPLADVVTDDPLAAVRAHTAPAQRRPLEIYAVSRVNPLFDDEVSPRKPASRAEDSDSPNNSNNHNNRSSSSGYGSPRYHSSSDYSSGTEEINGQRVYVGGRASALRPDALTVLEQNVAFVRGILVAAGRRRRRGDDPAALSPIPEGLLDLAAIPRPVWPRRPRRPAEPAASAPPDQVLRELSDTLGRSLDALRGEAPPPPPAAEDVLRELSVTLSRGLDALREKASPPPTEEVLRELSDKLGRGLASPPASPSPPPPPPEEVLRGSHRGPPPKESDDDTQPRESSSATETTSSSRASSSGYSDAAPLYGRRPPPRARVADGDCSLWTTYVGAGVVAGDVRLKADTKCYYPSLHRPDFTLDKHSAERLMRRIKSAKRRRCWCRVVTSFLGLLFFLLAVMVVSLLLTRGERLFGSL
ncbi:serine/arginine repetitive matrix protein 1 [Bacillus rossius redtenbacheri]|uniref:serine/arginine repetitive matrix protein 1 n=1 Tax=Bacillus rossius redtenbacheri TaxID=93214 RepID=UPI002FDE5CD9